MLKSDYENLNFEVFVFLIVLVEVIPTCFFFFFFLQGLWIIVWIWAFFFLLLGLESFNRGNLFRPPKPNLLFWAYKIKMWIWILMDFYRRLTQHRQSKIIDAYVQFALLYDLKQGFHVFSLTKGRIRVTFGHVCLVNLASTLVFMRYKGVLSKCLDFCKCMDIQITIVTIQVHKSWEWRI